MKQKIVWMRSRSEGFLLVLATAIISGFSIFINKFGVSVSGPYLFTTMKNAVVAMLFILVILFTKEFRKMKKLTITQWRNLFIVGILGGSVPFLLFFKGLSIGSAAHAGFIHKTVFVYAAILSSIFLKEKVSKIQILSSITLLFGLLLLLGTPASIGEGDLLVLTATILWAGENVVSKNLLKSIPANIVVLGRMGFGLFVLIPFTVSTGSGLFTISLESIAWIGVTSTLLFGYVLTYYHGLKRIKVAEATSVLILGSAITTILNAVFITQTISIVSISGVLFLLMGTGLTLGIHKGVVRCVSHLKALS